MPGSSGEGGCSAPSTSPITVQKLGDFSSLTFVWPVVLPAISETRAFTLFCPKWLWHVTSNSLPKSVLSQFFVDAANAVRVVLCWITTVGPLNPVPQGTASPPDSCLTTPVLAEIFSKVHALAIDRLSVAKTVCWLLTRE